MPYEQMAQMMEMDDRDRLGKVMRVRVRTMKARRTS